MKKRIRPKPELLWLSTVDRGRELELQASFDNMGHALLTIIADEADESLWAQFRVGETLVEVPLAVLKKAIDSSDDVHSEAWFERNTPDTQDPGLSAAARAFAKKLPGSDKGS